MKGGNKMRIHKNQKGMTLVEIVVVLLISSILMLICGSLIINSMQYFNTTSTANIDKLAADEISEQIRSTLAYANKVQVTDEEKVGKEWHSISISANNTLLIDGEEQFNEGFYNNRDLTLSVHRYKQDYRIDLLISFVNGTDTIYRREETLELINMKEHIIQDDNSDLTKITDTMKIYFVYDKNVVINDDADIPDIPEDLSGNLTVADEIYCKDTTNDKGLWKKEQSYVVGDFVQYPDANGTWYRLVVVAHDDTSTPPGTDKNKFWKRIDKEFTINTIYEKYDIVMYKNKYYQSLHSENSWFILEPGVWFGPKATALELTTPPGEMPDYCE